MLTRKGMSAVGMAVAILLVSTSLIVGVWIVSAVQQSFTLPTYAVTESITFTNATAYNVGNPYVNSVTSIGNSSGASYTLGVGNYSVDSGGNTITATLVCKPGYCQASNAWTVAYVYNPSSANTTLGQVFTTTWSSFQLGVVSLVVIAATAIIGILVSGFGRTGEE